MDARFALLAWALLCSMATLSHAADGDLTALIEQQASIAVSGEFVYYDTASDYAVYVVTQQSDQADKIFQKLFENGAINLQLPLPAAAEEGDLKLAAEASGVFLFGLEDDDGVIGKLYKGASNLDAPQEVTFADINAAKIIDGWMLLESAFFAPGATAGAKFFHLTSDGSKTELCTSACPTGDHSVRLINGYFYSGSDGTLHSFPQDGGEGKSNSYEGSLRAGGYYDGDFVAATIDDTSGENTIRLYNFKDGGMSLIASKDVGQASINGLAMCNDNVYASGFRFAPSSGELNQWTYDFSWESACHKGGGFLVLIDVDEDNENVPHTLNSNNELVALTLQDSTIAAVDATKLRDCHIGDLVGNPAGFQKRAIHCTYGTAIGEEEQQGVFIVDPQAGTAKGVLNLDSMEGSTAINRLLSVDKWLYVVTSGSDERLWAYESSELQGNPFEGVPDSSTRVAAPAMLAMLVALVALLL